MGDGGKGSKARPFSVDRETFSNNWDNIFKKDKVEDVKSNATQNGQDKVRTTKPSTVKRNAGKN
jgi:hypothetical protein